MSGTQSIKKPITRGRLRKKWGRRYFILKRYWNWMTSGKQWSKVNNNINFKHEVKCHKSIILRPLKGVEMYLQENKRIAL